MPTINQKLLLRLFLGFVVLTGTVLLVHYVQSDRSIEALRWQADNAAHDGKVDKAILYTSQYLEFRPDDLDAVVKLGDLYLKRSNTVNQLTQAMFQYEKVCREAPQREDVRRKLVDVCLRLGRHTDGMIHLQPLLQNHPDEAELWEEQAVCQTALNQLEEARKSFASAISHDPSRISSYDLLAQLLIQQMNLRAEGQACIEKMVKLNPMEPKAYLVRALYLRRENRVDDALNDVNQLLLLDPKNADGLVIFAEIMQARGEISATRKALNTGIAEYPKDVRFHRALSWLELNLNNLPAAVEVLEKGIVQLPNETELLTPLADLFAQQGEIEKAEAIIEKLEKRRLVPLQVSYLKARVLMQRGKYADALAIFEPLRTQVVGVVVFSTQINLLMAACYQKLGDRDSQEETLRRVLSLDGNNQTAHLQIGNVFLARGKLDDAIKEYGIAANSPIAAMATRIMLGRLQIAKARAGKVDDQDWTKIAQFAGELLEKHPQSAEPVLLMGEILLARRQYEAAQKFLREECSKRLNDPRIWALRATLAYETEGLYAAIDVLDEAQSLTGDAVDLRLARARLWSADWQAGQAERIVALGQNIEGFTDSEQLRLLANLGEICANYGNRAGVKRFYSEIARRMPKELPIRVVLFEFAAQEKDEALLDQLRKELARLQPADSDYLAVAEALAFDTDTPETRSMVDRILKRSPDRADAHWLAAQFAEKAGDRPLAQRHLDFAIEFDRGNLRYLQAELSFFLRTEQNDAARAMITRVYYDPRVSASAFQAFIEGGAGTDRQQVERCLVYLRPLAVRDVSSCLWAARYAQRHGLSKYADEFLTTAQAMAPKQVDGWVLSCLHGGRTAEQMQQLLQAARKSLDPRPYFLFCAEVQKTVLAIIPDWKPTRAEPEDARIYAQACLNTMSVRNNRQQALDFLSAFLKSADRPEDQAWANRNLAMLRATQGTLFQRREALVGLGKNGQELGSIDDMRSRITGLVIATRQLAGRERQRALEEGISLLEEIVKSPEANTRDWFHLAQFYRLAGQREKYRERIQDLMQREPANLYYVVVYVEDLLDTGELGAAEGFTGRLQKASYDPRAVATLGRYYCLKNAAVECLKLMETFYQATEPGTTDRIARQRQIAEMLDRLARLARGKRLNETYEILLKAALEKYQSAIRNYPEAVGPMAGLLAFDGKVNEAFEQLTRMKANLSAKLLTSAGLAVLANGHATARQFEMVLGWIEGGLAEQPGSAPLLMNLAGFHALRGDYQAAAEAYKKLLVVEPDNVVALNNRAWILASNPAQAKDALKLVEHAIELVGPTGELLDTRARIRITLGSLALAIDDLNQALNQSQSSLLYFHLALAQSKLLKFDEAMKAFKQAQSHGLDPRAIHPSDTQIYQTMLSGRGS